ncbi:endonuclease domain-containing protein [Microbacterium aurantiacum]|uniref:endonuclease domain-containing protein n=1 Tax=Microbacterium aurantiacum TaxID=162393 RepID=UPI003D750AFC
MDELTDAVSLAGGVVRVSALRSRGWSRRAIERRLATHMLTRPRDGWVALPGADPLLVAAARAGVVLSCLTQAERLGLWVQGDGCVHVAAPPKRHIGEVSDGTRVHWARPLVPRHPDVLVDPVENVLAVVARCRPHEQARAVWESALRQGLVVRESLRLLPLAPLARALLEECSLHSDSGLETVIPVRLRFLRLPIRQQVWLAGHAVDFVIGDRLVLQVDGGHHVGAQRRSDIAHDARLKLLGYHVIRIDYVQIMTRWSEVHDVIVRAVAQGLHRAR